MIDWHCHLDLYPDPAALIRECERRGMSVLSVTTVPSAWPGTSRLGHGRPCVRTALGLHPELAGQRHAELALFEGLLAETRFVGEIGLDGHPANKASWEAQLSAFRLILRLCERAGGRVLSVHSRRAASAVLNELERVPGAGRVVLHWFSGTVKELERAIAQGCWFSIGPGMIMGARGKALVAKIPQERVLTETDGPFVEIAGRPAMPWDVSQVVEAVASGWAVEAREAEVLIYNNLKRLLNP